MRAIKTPVKRLAGRAARMLYPMRSPDPQHWGLRATSAGLACHGRALAALAADHGTPLHVVDFARLEHNARGLLAARAANGTRARVLYSYKTNPVPGVLARLHALGVGAEVVSPYELWLAGRLGVPGVDVVYNGPVKSRESLAIAIDRDVACINANSLHDLHTIGEAACAAGRRARVGLRVTLASGWRGQFGFAQGSVEQATAIVYAREHPWLDLIGLHAHRGAWLRTSAQVREHVAGLMAERARLRREYRLSLPLVNVGGSLACPSVDAIGVLRQRLNRSLQVPLAAGATHTLTPAAYARVVLDAVAAGADDAPPNQIVLEPGRGLTGNAQWMLSTVLDIKPDPDGFDYAIVDAGTHNAESMRDERHAILPVAPRAEAPTRRYRVTGPLCRPDDVLCHSVELPQLRIGDRIAIMDTGAYFVALASPFSFARPAIVGLDAAGAVTRLRERERYADIIGRDHFDPEPG